MVQIPLVERLTLQYFIVHVNWFSIIIKLNSNLTRKSITCYYMLYKGVATCYLNLLDFSSCCFDTNSEFTEMFLMIHHYQNKWPLYIQTTLWICGPNNVTEKVPQNSLYQTNMDCWTVQSATNTKIRRVFKQQLILNHRIVKTYSESLTHIKIISHKLSLKCFVFKIVQAPWNKIATSN